MEKSQKNLNKKILFWVDPNFLQFGVAKFLQKKYDVECYAITDLNHHLQKSFMKQQVVDFKKVWHYWDGEFNSQKVDLDYLTNFEEKYNIPLWLLVYSERIFLSNYNIYYKFSSDEALQVIQHDCKLFEDVLDEANPDFLIIGGVDSHRMYLMAELCKSRGIKVLMLFSTRLGYRCVISSDFDQFDEDCIIPSEDIPTKDLHTLHEYIKKYDHSAQMLAIRTGGHGFPILFKLKVLFRWLTKTFDKTYRATYDHYGVTRYGIIKSQFLHTLKRWYRQSFLFKNSSHNISDELFAYFPLQVEPERNVLLGAPFYTNQLELIEKIAKSLPAGWKLYVKEHPSMRSKNWRKTADYKQIIDMPNVKLIHTSISPEEIMQKCSLVFTIGGTTAFDVSFYGKPSILFSEVMYSGLSWVHRSYNMEELPHAISEIIKKKVDVVELNNFVNKILANSFFFDEFKIYDDVFNRIHSGFIVGDDISMTDLNNYFEENKIVFEPLINAYIKKIKI